MNGDTSARQTPPTAPVVEVDRERNAATGDAGPGTGIKDLLPLPAIHPAEESAGTTKESVANAPTLSHALATDDHELKGVAQQDHADEVRDLGWNETKQNIAAPLVGGLNNEELWLLVRRFNKQIYHLKAVTNAPPGGLDLVEVEFSPDKMRSIVERLYMTVGVDLLAGYKHIARLRSWRETRRTSYFAATYFVAWLFDFLVPLFTAVLIALVAYQPSRHILFPPAPLALVDTSTGGVQKPKAGVLGSHDSVTGAPENHKGEAVEQEASNFFNGVATVALNGAAGKYPAGDPKAAENEQGGTDSTPDPTGLARSAAGAKDKSTGSKTGNKHDNTKVPMEKAMWDKMETIMHSLNDVADTWERFANALSPTRPFPRETSRLRLATLVIPLFGISLFVTSYIFIKGVMFGVGLGFFGDPVISRGLDWLNRTIPDWQKILELRNTILKGVPTNAQLALTLLRLGEANKAPIPPPPRIDEAPPREPAKLTDEQLRSAAAEPPLGANSAEINEAIQNDPAKARETGSSTDVGEDAKHGSKGNRILSFFRGTTKWFVKTAIGTDKVRAKIGSHHARDRLGAVPPVNNVAISGPVDFNARYNGKKGHVYLTTSSTIPAIGFSTKETREQIGNALREDLHPIWSVAIADIVELKKVGGYGWKARLVVGWSLEREVADGLEIKTATGEVHKVTALPLRDELFNRLIAIGGQKWEAW
ncbi:hypothetical protein B0T26DRAFT_873588 [Lasiosphaeria miniovina]|uniref:Uncharacterized protein n=1 Tax=Lasiosphaeria miniovina TaxID=1954250 RepID=A0AA40ACU8_9PEZI|nr:uncharacterized protein B0T26DRAFT_873588 [Lasiosphaeria miniovina]KAK0713424.1 hypothetical protein B0T26DRAFT_873588 [Lasiosphaeria miniovina]